MKMASAEEWPKEILQDEDIQQDGVVLRCENTESSQKENSAGIDIPKELETFLCIDNSVPASGDMCVFCDGYQDITEDDINSILDAEHLNGPAESNSETNARSAREQKMPIPQSDEGSKSETNPRSGEQKMPVPQSDDHPKSETNPRSAKEQKMPEPKNDKDSQSETNPRSAREQKMPGPKNDKDSQSETNPRSAREQKMSAPQSDEISSSCAKYQSFPAIENIPIRGWRKSHKARFQRQNLMKLITFLVFCWNTPSAYANTFESFACSAIVLNSSLPPSNDKDWFSGRTPILKDGILKNDCDCCQYLFRTEAWNLKITSTVGVRDLCDYRCAPPKVYVEQFPLKEFIPLCSTNSKFQEFLISKGGAEFEMRRKFDNDWIYRFNATNQNGILVIYPAQKYRQNSTGSSYCNPNIREGEESTKIEEGDDKKSNTGIMLVPRIAVIVVAAALAIVCVI